MKKYIVYFIIFCIALGLRIFAINQKVFVHHDEPFTFFGATPMNFLPDKNVKFKNTWDKFDIEYNKIYKAKDLKKSLFGSDRSLKRLISDLKEIRKNNIDSSHPILYYSVFRVFNTGFDGFDRHEGLLRGCFLNLLIFSLSFFFLYKMLNLIRPNDVKFISLGLFFAFCNTGSISNTVLLREYILAELFFNILLFLLVIIYKQIVDNKNFSVLQILVYPFLFGLGVQTGYFSLIFELIILLTIFTLLISYKRFKFLLNFFVIIFCSILWIVIIYPNYFYYLLHNEHINNIINIIVTFNLKYKDFLRYYYESLFYNVFFIIILFFYILSFKNPKTDIKLLCLPVIPVVIWNIIIINISSVSDLRFILPSLPALSLIMLFFTCNLKTRYVVITLVTYLVLSVIPIFKDDFKISKMEYLRNDSEISYINYNILEHRNIPVYAYLQNDTVPWFYTYMIYNYIDNNDIIFTKNLPDKTKSDFYLMYFTKDDTQLEGYMPVISIALGPEAYHGYYKIYYAEKK